MMISRLQRRASQRLDRNLQTLLESIEKAKNDKDNEERLRIILEERKAKDP